MSSYFVQENTLNSLLKPSEALLHKLMLQADAPSSLNTIRRTNFVLPEATMWHRRTLQTSKLLRLCRSLRKRPLYAQPHNFSQHWQGTGPPRPRLWPKKLRALISSNAARLTHLYGATSQTMANPTIQRFRMISRGRASLALNAIIPASPCRD